MKKIIVTTFIILLMLTNKNSFALTKLYEIRDSQTVNSGTILNKYKRLTDKGWLAINILEVNLKDENTSVGVLTSSNGLQTFQNVKTMLDNNSNCISAINADFFTGNYQKGNIIGMTIKDGKYLTSTYYENETKDTMASLYIDDNNIGAIDYFSNKITLMNLNNNEAFGISDINKWTGNYEYPVLHTREWGEKSPGLSLGIALTELVVENDVVKEIRNGMEAVDIPNNGYVVCAIGTSAENINSLFKKGDKVKLDIEIGINIEKIKMAVSGGAVLVRNGEIADFSHVISGSNPRSAIGLSKDCKRLYLVTIDGRQLKSIGVTQTELAEILIEKGIYNAINLDGGGSTTMVVRELGDTEATIENSPSGGSMRMVANAVGVFNTGKKGSLANLKIELDNSNLFVGCEKKVTIKGYDEYYNPIPIDIDKVKWTYTGAEVKGDGDTLKAGNEVGVSTVTASIGDAEASIGIDVLSMPNELTITPKKTTISKNENVIFSVKGQNKNGFYGNLNNSEVEWSVDGGASIDGGVFTATKDGSYIVEVSAGDAKAYALVNVISSETKVIDDFEKDTFKFVSYPSEVKGSVERSTEEVYEGKTSAKLSYDFTGLDVTRAVYLRFNEEVNIDKNAETLKVMLYATASTSDSVKAKIVDANGETKYLNLLKGLESKGWQELKLSLKNIALPAKLIDLYVVQDNENEHTSGSIYLDNMMIEYKSTGTESNVELPKDIKGEDEQNTYSELENKDSFRVVVSPEFFNGILLEQLKYRKMEDAIKGDSEVVIYPYKNGDAMLTNVSKEKIFGDMYSINSHNNLTIITLNITSDGLRATDSNQWIYLQNDIKVSKKNVLIVLNGNIEDFSDSMEKELLIDILCDLRRSEGKNIWVIQTGDNTDYSMKRGVKYLTIGSSSYNPETVSQKDLENSNYIVITINGNKMTYEIKKVFSNGDGDI